MGIKLGLVLDKFCVSFSDASISPFPCHLRLGLLIDKFFYSLGEISLPLGEVLVPVSKPWFRLSKKLLEFGPSLSKKGLLVVQIL